MRIKAVVNSIRAASIASGSPRARLLCYYPFSSHGQARGTETFEHVLKKFRNLRGVAPLDVTPVQHVQELAVTE